MPTFSLMAMVQSGFWSLQQRCAGFVAGGGGDVADADGARARRDFVNEIVTRNPDAFASEVGVQQMMMLFPDRF